MLGSLTLPNNITDRAFRFCLLFVAPVSGAAFPVEGQQTTPPPKFIMLDGRRGRCYILPKGEGYGSMGAEVLQIFCGKLIDMAAGVL